MHVYKYAMKRVEMSKEQSITLFRKDREGLQLTAQQDGDAYLVAVDH